MLERDEYPVGVPCWIDTSQPDPAAAVAFYGGLFGWEFEDSMPPESPGRYFVGRLRGRDVAAIGSVPSGMRPTPVWNTYVMVESTDETAAKVTRAGGQVVTPPFDIVNAGRMAVVADPAGAGLCIWQARAHKGAQLVNEPNTWNWSDLNTRDIQGARAFYAAVFGWESNPVDFGSGESYMWRVPGYADFLETKDPGVRSRHAEGGAPEGFTDAIGWLQLMTNDQFSEDVPPHWSVTFSVDNTDAIAQRAEKVGGKVTVPPFDVPYARIAVITDPQGAVFTVSKYDPSGG
jgi:predicted enzyme related to lactoylglutathione lyase